MIWNPLPDNSPLCKSVSFFSTPGQKNEVERYYYSCAQRTEHPCDAPLLLLGARY